MAIRNLSRKAAIRRKVKAELGISFSVRDVKRAIAGLTAPRQNRIGKPAKSVAGNQI